jgi:hypothetical protein
MNEPAEPDDELLAALDQLTDAVHWLSVRTAYRAAEALSEAITDWLADNSHPIDDSVADEPRRAGGLGDAVAALTVAFDGLDGNDADRTVERALAEAINQWVAAVSAQHHRSEPFQRRFPPGR